jgi:predicted transcriptional regulator
MAEQLLLEVKSNRRFQSNITNDGTFDYSKTGIVLNSIERCPGIRYRELLRFSGLTNGALEYILRILEKTDRIKVERQNGKRPRYYPLNMMSSELVYWDMLETNLHDK